MRLATLAFWVARARGKRLDRVSFADNKPGRASNRTAQPLEQLILETRQRLREQSALGEFGPDAIRGALTETIAKELVPARATIHRVLERRGVLDAVHRQRRSPPPKGWYLPDLANGNAELDSFDFIECVNLKGIGSVDVLTGTSLHGALADAWVLEKTTARVTVEILLERWRREGLPTYAQFDNDSVFQGAHQFSDNAGRVSRLCLALGVVQVFAPPREPGFQNAIEGFNGLWQAKVWRRQWFEDLQSLREYSARYIEAYRAKTAIRRESAPKRRPVPRTFKLDLQAQLKGKMIFLRRSNETGYLYLPGGKPFRPDKNWCNRLVRCEIDFTLQRVRFFALRRRDPDRQPLLSELHYPRPKQPFKGQL